MEGGNNMEDTRQFSVLQSISLRNLIEKANTFDIKKEEVISLFQDSRTEEFILIYYK